MDTLFFTAFWLLVVVWVLRNPVFPFGASFFSIWSTVCSLLDVAVMVDRKDDDLKFQNIHYQSIDDFDYFLCVTNLLCLIEEAINGSYNQLMYVLVIKYKT